MTRVDELQKRYPNVPREVVIKLDALRYGIRDSQVLDNVGRWVRAAGMGTYQSYDHDVTNKEIAEKRPDTVRPGYVKHLHAFHMKNAMGVRVERDSTSPYEIKELGSDRYGLYEGEEKVEEVYFPRLPWPYEEREEPLTSKGTPVTSLVSMKAPNCFMIMPVRHCEYFVRGEQCKFCNFNQTHEDARSVGLNWAVTMNQAETVEAYQILSSETRFVEGMFEMGALKDSDQEAKVHIDYVEKIASQASYKPNLSVFTQPTSRRNMQRLKDAGVNCLGYQMEVWDPRLFAEICPGKAQHIGYERYKEAYLEAVDIFGAGNVTATFVGGVTLMPQNGFKTWQESRDSLIEGNTWLIKNGVFPFYITLRLGPGSIYGDDRSNRAKLPPTEFFIDAAVAHHEAMTEYGLYETLNRLTANCPFDCLDNHYTGDLGILELAGDPGNWLAGLVPDRANWLAKFIASVRSTARAE